jgi:hypothetical protein
VKLFGVAVAAGILLTACQTDTSIGVGDPLSRFLREALQIDSYRSAEIDLNGDGRSEHVVYATNPERCGSGGCTMFVVASTDRGFEVVSRTTITRPPILVLETATNGWRDLAVSVAGGGSPAYFARLPFDGSGYARNPTVPPASPVEYPAALILIDR